MSPQTKGMLGGVGLIVWGVAGAVWTYLSDSNSFDYFRMNNATSLAALHAVLFCSAGAAVFAWSWFLGKTQQDD
jgi:hypothetical protein